ncbi:hypothetical protein JOM56_000943 [Amanita muscaria]
MDLVQCLDNVQTCLQENGLTIPTYIRGVLTVPSSDSHSTVCEGLLFEAEGICSDLAQHSTSDSVFLWAFETVKTKLCQEVVVLTHQRNGLHFNASKTTSEYLEGSFMQTAARKIKEVAPNLWTLVNALLDANPARRRAMPRSETQILEELAAQREGDLGEIGGEGEGSDEDELEEDAGANKKEAKAKKRRIRAASRNTALILIKAVVSISIFAQSTNERCNYLQSVLGIFYHSTAVPEKVIETLAHAGLSISLTSIHSAVKSLSQDAARKIKAALRTLTTALAYDNFDINFKSPEPTVERPSSFVSATSATAIPLFAVGNPDALRRSQHYWEKDPRNPSPSAQPIKIDTEDLSDFHLRSSSRRAPGQKLSPLLTNYAWHIRYILIPLHQTTQIPCKSMNIKESTPDGNVEVLESLLRQGGIGEPEDKKFDHEKDVDMSEHVLLVHGDLLTKERLDTVQDSRSIEGTPKRRFQYVIFLPGLFHFKMACVDALWRTWVQPKESCLDDNGDAH